MEGREGLKREDETLTTRTSIHMYASCIHAHPQTHRSIASRCVWSKSGSRQLCRVACLSLHRPPRTAAQPIMERERCGRGTHDIKDDTQVHNFSTARGEREVGLVAVSIRIMS